MFGLHTGLVMNAVFLSHPRVAARLHLEIAASVRRPSSPCVSLTTNGVNAIPQEPQQPQHVTYTMQFGGAETPPIS